MQNAVHHGGITYLYVSIVACAERSTPWWNNLSLWLVQGRITACLCKTQYTMAEQPIFVSVKWHKQDMTYHGGTPYLCVSNMSQKCQNTESVHNP